MAGETKRLRKPNWTKTEICCLIEGVATHQSLIFSKFRTTDSNKKKNWAWDDVLKTVSAQTDTTARSVDEVKKKWKDLTSRAKKDVHNRKHPKTGGGPKPQEGEWTETILSIFGEDSPMFYGVEAGGESGETPQCSQSQRSFNIPVTVGVPFTIPDQPECVVLEMARENPNSRSTLPQTQAALDEFDEEIQIVSMPPQSPSPPPAALVPARGPGFTSTPKRTADQCGRPKAKQHKTGHSAGAYDHLVTVDIERVEIEKEKLKLEIENIKAKREAIESQRMLKEGNLKLQREVLLLQKQKLQLEINTLCKPRDEF